MNQIPATWALNPAFKRHQCLPELLPARLCRSSTAAPHAFDLRQRQSVLPPAPALDERPAEKAEKPPSDDGFTVTS